MRKPARIRIAILALMLVVSHVALMSHVTAHFEPQLEQCELCVSQGQLFTAIPSPDHGAAVEPGITVSHFNKLQCVISARHCLTCNQRAPPIPST